MPNVYELCYDKKYQYQKDTIPIDLTEFCPEQILQSVSECDSNVTLPEVLSRLSSYTPSVVGQNVVLYQNAIIWKTPTGFDVGVYLSASGAVSWYENNSQVQSLNIMAGIDKNFTDTLRLFLECSSNIEFAINKSINVYASEN